MSWRGRSLWLYKKCGEGDETRSGANGPEAQEGPPAGLRSRRGYPGSEHSAWQHEPEVLFYKIK